MSMHSRRLPGGDKTEDMTGGGGGDRRLYARSFIDTNIRARLGREILFALYIFTVMITLFRLWRAIRCLFGCLVGREIGWLFHATAISPRLEKPPNRRHVLSSSGSYLSILVFYS